MTAKKLFHRNVGSAFKNLQKKSFETLRWKESLNNLNLFIYLVGNIRSFSSFDS